MASNPLQQEGRERRSALAGPDPSRILVRGVNWLGDAVMTTPALLRLRERFPRARMTLATLDKLADLWAGHPAVDEVLTFRAGESPWAVGRRWRAGSFDVALALPNSHRSAIELRLAGIPRRYGSAAPFRSWLLTHPVGPRAGEVRMIKPDPERIRRRLEAGTLPSLPPGSAHHIHHYLHLVSALGADAGPVAPRLHVGSDEVDAARVRFGLGPGCDWVGINPGAEYGPAKRWPIERFAAVAAEVGRRKGCGFVVLGGRGDQALAAEFVEQLRGRGGGDPVLPVVNLAGRTSLRELGAVLRVCRVLVTNDTGPMHVAAALEVPVVGLFGSTSPELTGPGLPGDARHQILRRPVACAPCFLRECPVDFRCLRGIETAEVVEATLAVLARQRV